MKYRTNFKQRIFGHCIRLNNFAHFSTFSTLSQMPYQLFCCINLKQTWVILTNKIILIHWWKSHRHQILLFTKTYFNGSPHLLFHRCNGFNFTAESKTCDLFVLEVDKYCLLQNSSSFGPIYKNLKKPDCKFLIEKKQPFVFTLCFLNFCSYFPLKTEIKIMFSPSLGLQLQFSCYKVEISQE